LDSKDLVVGRHGRGWSVGAPGEVMLVTSSRKEAEQLAREAAAVLRKKGVTCNIHGPDETVRPPEPRSFRQT
jgi:hypothetical protein